MRRWQARPGLKKKDSFDEMGTTYVSPDHSLRINATGVRDESGAYLEHQVDPSTLVVLQELGRGASAVTQPLLANRADRVLGRSTSP